MIDTTSKLDRNEFAWLPERFTSPCLVSENESNFLSGTAVQVETQTTVYIETIPASQFDSDGLFRMEHNFNYASRLKVDSYVTPIEWGHVFDDTRQQELVYLIRPFVAGETFEELLRVRDKPAGLAKWNRHLPTIPMSQSKWIRNVLVAIEQLHQIGITQQDFRLSNLIITTDGLPRLICPGLRLFSKPDCRDTTWSVAFGKSASPELLGLIGHDVNDRSDIYSVGVILYSLLTGQLPFDGNSLGEILAVHLNKQIEIEDQTVPESLKKIAIRMLSKNPKDRYQSVSSVMFDLEWLDENGLDCPKFISGRSDVGETITIPMFVGRKNRA